MFFRGPNSFLCMGILSDIASAFNPLGVAVDAIVDPIVTAFDAYHHISDYMSESDKMALQAQLNLQNATALQNQQHQHNLESMEVSQGYNRSNMIMQGALNDYLTSATRSATQLRQSGLNPSGISGSSAGSVTSSTPTPLASSGSVPGVSQSNSNPHPSQQMLAGSAARKTNSEADLNNIDILTRLQENRLRLEEMKSQVSERASHSKNMDASTKSLLDRLDSEIDLNERMASYYEQSGLAAAKNADTAAAAQQETVRHNKVMETVSQVSNEIASRGVRVQEAQLHATVSEIEARARSLNSQADLTDSDVAFYFQKLCADLDVKYANKEYFREMANMSKEQARKIGKEADWYEFNMIATHAEKILSECLDLVPTKRISKIVESVGSSTRRSSDGTYRIFLDRTNVHEDTAIPVFPWQRGKI